MQTVLAKIVADKAIWVEARKQQQPLASFQNEIVPTQRNFYDALAGTRTAFILECKKASPSKGLIREDFDPAAIASIYKHYASAISVLCDEKYFQGSFDFLPIVSQVAPQPILCKDFTIDPYQIYLARYYQADACLLMLSVLDDEQYRQLSAVAHSLNMGVLTEVSNEEELERAIALKAKVVGINNRDLRDMSIDLNRTRQLAARLGPDVTVISESGIHTYAEVRELSHFANGFLIGSALMEQADLEAAVKRVLLGENKVCGLTRPQDAQVAWESGAIYGGLIFVPTSPRAVNDAQAKAVIAAAPLQYVGVFRNAPLEEVVARAQALGLEAVQLHGDAVIVAALSVGETFPARTLRHVDKYLLDNGQGGSGQRFDWSLLQGQDLRNVMLAGGLGADNCVEAAKSGCAGLDFNSGVESQPGIKDASKLASVFQTLRAY
ncbi:bifunctional indole-3-glycerol-phosphate synthase TrpC/phosphoribosylanthranilate isomerase TrpF [Klebsiella pneumoniae]|uniref:bifunctional indole-3-glycerol-phosphate synthase TrpC/phosphoribosylanthranilate isomerase TrpF n=1 Tax=Klebsiella pneumoniae TaxID=573 RepID=UPI001888DA43|nr:bifunctional indole-3-glycerol-phosphate synthase TrpC/phosphoribosylanthranilate isomerase TrpF [Klebsiella pneumoniae]